MVEPKQGLASPSAMPTTTLGRKWQSIHCVASRDQIPGTATPWYRQVTAPTPETLERRDDTVEIVPSDQHVAVGQHDHRMAGLFGHVDEVGHLAVGAPAALVGHERHGDVREHGPQPVHHGDRGIIGPPDAEHDLDRSCIILGTKGRQVAQEERLVAVERLQQADARPRPAAVRRTRSPVWPCPTPDQRRSQEGIGTAGAGEDHENQGDDQNALMSLLVCASTAAINPSKPCCWKAAPYSDRQVASWLIVPLR